MQKNIVATITVEVADEYIHRIVCLTPMHNPLNLHIGDCIEARTTEKNDRIVPKVESANEGRRKQIIIPIAIVIDHLQTTTMIPTFRERGRTPELQDIPSHHHVRLWAEKRGGSFPEIDGYSTSLIGIEITVIQRHSGDQIPPAIAIEIAAGKPARSTGEKERRFVIERITPKKNEGGIIARADGEVVVPIGVDIPERHAPLRESRMLVMRDGHPLEDIAIAAGLRGCRQPFTRLLSKNDTGRRQ